MSDATFHSHVAAPGRSVSAAIVARFLKMETISYFSAPAAVFWTFFYPIALFFILNTIFGGGSSPSGMGLSYTDYLITGLAVMTLLSTALFGFATVLVDMRAQNNLRNIAFMPIEKSGFFAGFVGSRLLALLVFLTLFFAGFTLLTQDVTYHGPSTFLLVIAYLMSGAFALIGFSLVLTTFFAKPATAAAIANVINIPVIFMSDLFLPAALFPEQLFAIISRGPFYLFVNQLRAIFAGQSGFTDAAPMMAAMMVAGMALMVFAARRAKWHA